MVPKTSRLIEWPPWQTAHAIRRNITGPPPRNWTRSSRLDARSAGQRVPIRRRRGPEASVILAAVPDRPAAAFVINCYCALSACRLLEFPSNPAPFDGEQRRAAGRRTREVALPEGLAARHNVAKWQRRGPFISRSRARSHSRDVWPSWPERRAAPAAASPARSAKPARPSTARDEASKASHRHMDGRRPSMRRRRSSRPPAAPRSRCASITRASPR